MQWSTYHSRFRFVRVHPDFDEMVDYGDWGDGEFVLGRGILASVSLDLSLDAEPILAFDAALGGVGESLQFEHLADGMKRDLNGAISDLSAFPVVSLPDPLSETKKEVDAVAVWHHISEHVIHTNEGFNVLAPNLPIALSLVVIRSHDPNVDVLPRGSEKVREFSLAVAQAEEAPRVVFVDLSIPGLSLSFPCPPGAMSLLCRRRVISFSLAVVVCITPHTGPLTAGSSLCCFVTALPKYSNSSTISIGFPLTVNSMFAFISACCVL
jgi:hypothetical protein